MYCGRSTMSGGLLWLWRNAMAGGESSFWSFTATMPGGGWYPDGMFTFTGQPWTSEPSGSHTWM